jgi:hydroxymethylbilane synthase
LRALRPDLDLRELRGNVNTRIGRLEAGDFDAIVLALAGMKRLGLDHHVTAAFGTDALLPAIGQGVIGIECRRGDQRIEALVAALDDPHARDVIGAERALNATLQGGCQVPIAGHAELHGDELSIRGLVASLDGREFVRAAARGPRAQAAALGEQVGQELLERGARRILDAILPP